MKKCRNFVKPLPTLSLYLASHSQAHELVSRVASKSVRRARRARVKERYLEAVFAVGILFSFILAL